MSNGRNKEADGMFEILDSNQMTGTVIRVIGVGGAGGNAVDHMIRNGVGGVEFFAFPIGTALAVYTYWVLLRN